MDRKNHNYILGERDFLKKVRNEDSKTPTGFLSKLNKDGSIPVAFADWPKYLYGQEKPEISVHTETLRSGWKISGFRFGESQNWAILVHPNGFKLEIHADSRWSDRNQDINERGYTLTDIIKNFDIYKGYIAGEFRWEGSRLYTNE